MKQSVLDICNAKRVTIITFKEISVTSPSVQAEPHMLALTRGSDTEWRGEAQFSSSSADRESLLIQNPSQVRITT